MKNILKKTGEILLNASPVILMIIAIPFIANDYILAIFDALVVFTALTLRREKNDLAILGFGFCIMIASEAFFISTGVETFQRNSLFGLMPIWLPILWAYAFIAIKRSVEVLNRVER